MRCTSVHIKAPSLSRAHLLIGFYAYISELCTRSITWVNFSNCAHVWAGPVVGRLTSCVVGGGDAGVAPDCWREGERLQQTEQRVQGIKRLRKDNGGCQNAWAEPREAEPSLFD